MKRTILTIALIAISFAVYGQRYCPKMENQITEEDSLSDEFENEYKAIYSIAIEEETTVLVEEYDSIKNVNIIDPDREIPSFDLEKIIYIDIKKLDEELAKEDEEDAKKEDEENTIINPKK